jgi:hypothetical protein
LAFKPGEPDCLVHPRYRLAAGEPLAHLGDEAVVGAEKAAAFLL